MLWKLRRHPYQWTGNGLLICLTGGDLAQQSRAHAQLLADFDDVLRDPVNFTEEDVLPPMKGSPMRIHLVEDAQPFFHSTARPMQYAWRADGAALLQRMVQHRDHCPVDDRRAVRLAASHYLRTKGFWRTSRLL